MSQFSISFEFDNVILQANVTISWHFQFAPLLFPSSIFDEAYFFVCSNVSNKTRENYIRIMEIEDFQELFFEQEFLLLRMYCGI